MWAELCREDLDAALDKVVAELLERAEIDRPPVDALELARRLGIRVAIDRRQRSRARCARLKTSAGWPVQPVILLRPEPRAERRQWAVAHEIGEHAVSQVVDALTLDPREATPALREQTANQLASRLLLPSPWFGRDATGCGWDLAALKQRYSTASHELIARRMLEWPAPLILTIVDQEEIYLRTSNLPGRVPPPDDKELRVWRRVHESGRPVRTRRSSGRIQAWPVHEDHWKREILRTELPESQ